MAKFIKYGTKGFAWGRMVANNNPLPNEYDDQPLAPLNLMAFYIGFSSALAIKEVTETAKKVSQGCATCISSNATAYTGADTPEPGSFI